MIDVVVYGKNPLLVGLAQDIERQGVRTLNITGPSSVGGAWYDSLYSSTAQFIGVVPSDCDLVEASLAQCAKELAKDRTLAFCYTDYLILNKTGVYPCQDHDVAWSFDRMMGYRGIARGVAVYRGDWVRTILTLVANDNVDPVYVLNGLMASMGGVKKLNIFGCVRRTSDQLFGTYPAHETRNQRVCVGRYHARQQSA